MPLVINSLGGGHTHTQTHTHILKICTGSILRNQACAWFKKYKNKLEMKEIYKVEANKRLKCYYRMKINP